MKVTNSTNSYSAQVFPSIFNCGDLYCNFGHLSSRPGQDAKKRPLWVKKHPFCKGHLKNVRGSLGCGLLSIGKQSIRKLCRMSGHLKVKSCMACRTNLRIAGSEGQENSWQPHFQPIVVKSSIPRTIQCFAAVTWKHRRWEYSLTSPGDHNSVT